MWGGIFSIEIPSSQVIFTLCKVNRKWVQAQGWFVSGSFQQEVSNLKDAKQLLIQQKLELQGKVDSLKAALEQEKESQRQLREQVKKEEEKRKEEFSEREAKLVGEPT